MSGKDVFPTLTTAAEHLWQGGQEAFSGDYFIGEPMPFAPGDYGSFKEGIGPLRANHGGASGGTENVVVCSPNPNIGIAILDDQGGSQMSISHDKVGTLRAEAHGHLPCFCAPLAFKIRQGCEGGGKGYLGSEDKAFTLSCNQDQQIFVPPVAPAITSSGPPYSRTGNSRVETEALVTMHQTVRRITPKECERLQGFPDDWTDIPYKGKPAPDGPRYKALGNSMAVPVMRWIGERIQLVEEGKL